MNTNDICFNLEYKPFELQDLPSLSMRQDKFGKFWFLKIDLGNVRKWVNADKKNPVMLEEILMKTDKGLRWVDTPS
jgi:hypothetical protein